MARTKKEMARGTYITRDYPWGINIAARAECPDGIVRQCSRVAATADTFFSIPASVKVRGKTVAGYITVEAVSGLSTATDADPAIVRFSAYKNRKNHAVF